MKEKIAFLFPGQGAQYVGMGKDFFEEFAEAKEIFLHADELLGYSLSTLLFEGPMEELTKTKHSQLGIFVMSAALLEVFRKNFPDIKPSACAGLSLGEYSAIYAAGFLSFEETLLLVQKRAELMNEACEKQQSLMAAVMGLSLEQIKQMIEPLEEVWVANYNTPDQIVITGSKEGVEKAMTLLQENGAKRVIPLQVHGAFHSPLMKSAEDSLMPFIEKAPFKESSTPVVMNVNASFTQDVKELKDTLKKQITRSVLWRPTIDAMKQQGITNFLEIGCGKTLSAMNRKIDSSLNSLYLAKVSDLSKLKEKGDLLNVT